jgi:hypothetical protein
VVNVFICYGGSNGRLIGLSLRQYFFDHCAGTTPFLAGKDSPDIAAGQDFQAIIGEKLLDAHVVVTICDLNLMFSKYAREEIDTAIEKGILIIPFVVNGRKLPDKLRNVWAPIRYDPLNPNAKFPELILAVNNSLVVRIADFFVRDLGTNPDTGIPFHIVRDVRRGR